MRGPTQARSRRSQTRILDAAESLMEDRDFERVSVPEIAAAAGMSVGNIYARFKSKAVLLDALHARYEADRTAWLSARFSELPPDAGLVDRIHTIVASLTSLFRRRRGVLRSFILRTWADPSAAGRDRVEAIGGHYDGTAALLLGARGEIAAADKETAARTAVYSALAILRDAIVLRPADLPGGPDLDDAALIDELTLMMTAYLKAGSRRRRRDGEGERH